MRPPDRALPGSSPRGRGTPRVDQSTNALGRFIPAWAGNARAPPPAGRRRPVHPRVGGERLPSLSSALPVSGSSPRGRGTQHRVVRECQTERFIPAWAGNAPRLAETLKVVPVHPRVGGERPVDSLVSANGNGSSPRGRGTLVHHSENGAPHRFIPAWAGNASLFLGAHLPCAVHPRVGGERSFRKVLKNRAFHNVKERTRVFAMFS